MHLYKSLGSPQRLFDAPSSTWFFDCHHDAANESTFEGCGPWPDARAPVTTQICAPLFAAPCARLCYGRAAVPRHNTHSAVAVLHVRIPATDLELVVRRISSVWAGYDDAASSEAKFAAVKAAGWRGVGFWQASGM